MEQQKEKRLIRTVCIDTLTGIMNEMWMSDMKKASHDKWFDYGKGLWQLITDLQTFGFEIILILGEPGTGKSSGMHTLPSGTNIWFNADNKNPVWIGGKEEYGKKNSPKKPYHIIPKNYSDITSVIKAGLDRGMFEQERYAILTGHTEDYRTEQGEMKRKLKVLGQLATKMQLEGRVETVLYSDVKANDDGERDYILYTQNSGFNTARSPMGLFDPIIKNDYKFVVDKLMNY